MTNKTVTLTAFEISLALEALHNLHNEIGASLANLYAVKDHPVGYLDLLRFQEERANAIRHAISVLSG